MRKKNRLSLLDIVLLLTVLGAVAFVVYRLFWGMHYNWNWQVVLPYIYYIDPETGVGHTSVILDGLVTTIKISIWGMLFAIILGFISGMMRTSKRLLPRLIGTSYIALIRNTPPLVLIFVFYFFVADQVFSYFQVDDFFRNLSPALAGISEAVLTGPDMVVAFLSGILTLALFQGAYIGEIVRAGIMAIDRGQWEASSALGLGYLQQLRLVILPQAIRTMLPTLANEFINTIKWSSIVSIISIQELTFQGMQVMASTQATLEVWIIITLMYLVLCVILSYIVQRIDRRLANPQRMRKLAL